MELEIMFPTLAAAFFGAVVWILATIPHSRASIGAPIHSERRAWWRLVWPLFAGVLVLAFFAGWALQEPNPADERVAHTLTVLAGLTGLILFRASWRAAVSLNTAQTVRLPIVTVGMLRCRCVVSEEFRRTARPEALRAALAHELVHMRRRDPLRIWVAQFAADLQWPVPFVRRRLDAWLLALELRSDDEAVAMGASSLDLAEALLLAARQISVHTRSPVAAATTGDATALALRVRRLLHEQRVCPLSRAGKSITFVLCSALVLASGLFGLLYGETLLGFLPGVGR